MNLSESGTTTFKLGLFTILAAVFSTMVSSQDMGIVQIRLIDPVIFLFIIYFLFTQDRLRIANTEWYLIVPLLLSIVYFMILMFIVPFSPVRSIVQLIEFSQVILALIIFSSLFISFNNTQREYALYVMFLSCIFVAIITILFAATGAGANEEISFFILSFGIYYGTVYYIYTTKKVYLIGVILISIALLVRGRRSELIFIPLALATVFFVYYKISSYSINKNDLAKAVVGIATVSGFSIIANLSGIERLIYLYQLGLPLFDGRLSRWAAGIEALRHFPLGVGLGNYSDAVEYVANRNESLFIENILEENVIQDRLSLWAEDGPGAHSSFFAFLVEGGPIGGSLFILFWIGVWKATAIKIDEKSIIVLQSTLLFIFFDSIFNVGWVASQGRGIVLMIFVSLGISIKLNNID